MSKEVRICQCGAIHFFDDDILSEAFENDKDVLLICGSCGPHREMFNVFNMGIGMMIIVKPEDSDKVISILESKGEKAYKIGEITNQKGVVIK